MDWDVNSNTNGSIDADEADDATIVSNEKMSERVGY